MVPSSSRSSLSSGANEAEKCEHGDQSDDRRRPIAKLGADPARSSIEHQERKRKHGEEQGADDLIELLHFAESEEKPEHRDQRDRQQVAAIRRRLRIDAAARRSGTGLAQPSPAVGEQIRHGLSSTEQAAEHGAPSADEKQPLEGGAERLVAAVGKIDKHLTAAP